MMRILVRCCVNVVLMKLAILEKHVILLFIQDYLQGNDDGNGERFVNVVIIQLAI